ncbi:MAG: adenylate/guanylate cyclase domain-containing protein [Coleofasciculaceae cyanobacterium]
MSSRFLSLFSLFKARLSRKIALCTFASIVVIEAIILVPSYFSEERRQLRQLEEVSGEVVDGVVRLTQQDMSGNIFKDKIEGLTIGSDIIRGVTIYQADGELIRKLGEIPEIAFSDLKDNYMIRSRSQDGKRYDVAWSSQALGVEYVLIVRHNSSSIQKKLSQYILRIAGIVFIISIFVTGTTMLVLGATVIVPILRLRQDLIAAGDYLSKDNHSPNFYSLSVQRQDELGEVMEAFNSMFKRVSTEIAQRKQAEEILRQEQAKSEELLLNILPQPIAERLKQKQSCIADGFKEVTILFADIVGFTQLSARVSPEKLVNLLNEIFSTFDELTERHNLEKIKTIGDAYMVASGLPNPCANHAEAIAEMALDMQEEVTKFSSKYGEDLKIRIGINTGPVVAGVIGTKKFIYDLWGDAVNIASRMESHGVAGGIQVSADTYKLLKDDYLFQERGVISIKGKGEMSTYLLISHKTEKLISA